MRIMLYPYVVVVLAVHIYSYELVDNGVVSGKITSKPYARTRVATKKSYWRLVLT